MPNLNHYKRRVTEALKKASRYSPVLTIQIENLASALQVRSGCDAVIEELFKPKGGGPLLKVSTSQGTVTKEHPIFKIHRDALEQVNRQMKQLGLTTEEVVGRPEVSDAADELIATINAIK